MSELRTSEQKGRTFTEDAAWNIRILEESNAALRARVIAAEVVMAMVLVNRPLVATRQAVKVYTNRYPEPLADESEVNAFVRAQS